MKPLGSLRINTKGGREPKPGRLYFRYPILAKEEDPEVTESSFNITFEDVPPAQAGAFAQELREYILNEAPEVKIARERDDSDAMDAGATLAIILSSTAIAAVAKGIQTWLERRTKSSIKVKFGDREFEANHLTCKQATELSGKLSALLRMPAVEEA